MSQPPQSGHIYFIINRQLNLAWDLSRESYLVVGTPLKEEETQKWMIQEDGDFWYIQNLADKRFANLQRDDPILPGVSVITAPPREWEIRPDPEFGGLRIINPESRLNAVVGLANAPPLPEPPVVLEKSLPEENQIWMFVETHP